MIQASSLAVAVYLTNGMSSVSSQDVARHFGKQHHNVMRAITALVKQHPDHAPNFGRMMQREKLA